MPKLPIIDPTGYKHFMQVEPQKNLGPIQEEFDPIFNRKVRTRQVSIGMVRNASEDRRKTVKVFLQPYPHIRIANAKPLQGWYRSKEESNKICRPRPCYTEAMLTEPYGGFCQVGCAVCYINSGVRGYRGTGLITVPLNYGEQVRKQLSKCYIGAAGYFTSFHDPFNSLEEIYHNSQQAAEAFTEVGLPIFFLSRLRYPDWAIDLLKQNKYSYAQKSINTSVTEDWKKLSPGAAPLAEQYEDIRKLSSQGIYVSIQVNPVIPGVVSHADIKELFKQLAAAGANHVIIKFAEAAYAWAPTMVKKMITRFGERGRNFERLFTQNIGGEKSVDEEYRMSAHKMYQRWATEVGLTYSTCYEYQYERNAEGAIVNKAGISLGPLLTTSDQCHGKRVPVFIRSSLEGAFKPLKACPKNGCLYCADYNKGEARCGNVTLGKAKALKLSDYRKPFYSEEE